jgi:hypothetical protein
MSQDTLSESFSKLSTKEKTIEENNKTDNDRDLAKPKATSVDKGAIIERLRRLTKDAEQSRLSCLSFKVTMVRSLTFSIFKIFCLL